MLPPLLLLLLLLLQAHHLVVPRGKTLIAEGVDGRLDLVLVFAIRRRHRLVDLFQYTYANCVNRDVKQARETQRETWRWQWAELRRGWA